MAGGSGGAASSGSGTCINSLPAPIQTVVEPTPAVVERPNVSISMEVLKTIQERLVSAENEVSKAFLLCCAQAQKLDRERKILAEQIEHIASCTGEEPQMMSSSSKGNITISLPN